MMPESYNDNHTRLSEAEAYFNSLVNPGNLNSGDTSLLPKDLQEKWESLASMEEDYYTEHRFLHPDERKGYQEQIRTALNNFRNDINILYQEYTDSKNNIIAEPEISMRKSNTEYPPTLMRQYDEMKSKHPDAILLFRQNDSYEIYRQDAQKAKDILGLDMESRKIGGVKTDVVSFKEHSLDMYLPKLVRAGMRVAICEQLEDPKQKKVEKDSKETLSKSTDMPRKKKEKAPEQEQPKAQAKTKSEAKTEAGPEVKVEPKAKAEVKTGQKTEAQQERKPREPQMVTVNGGKVTHGHAFQGKDSQDWYFTAKIDGVQLKPQKMDPADLAAYQKKEMTVPQLMERYYPTKLMPKVPDMAFSFPNGIAGPDGPLTVNKFNVYKETDQKRDDFGKYKFYAQVGDQKMSTVASRQDLNAYFDRVMTPGDLVTKNFGERLHLKGYYDQFKLPEGIDPKSIRIAKDRNANQYMVTVKTGEDRGSTLRKHISYDDGYSFFKAKTASSEQLAAKYLGTELKTLLAAPAVKAEKLASLKM